MDLEFLKPLDGPTGTRRLIDIIKSCLESDNFLQFRAAVAFSKSGLIIRLRSFLLRWREAQKNAQIILGIDHRGTTKEALENAIGIFDAVYITHNPMPNCTFHPKIYIFYGPQSAKVIFGSHNLTVGGFETNYESGIVLNLSLPEEQGCLEEALECWNELLPENCQNTILLTNELINRLNTEGFLANESSTSSGRAGTTYRSGNLQTNIFPAVPPVSPTSIPRRTRRRRVPRRRRPVIEILPPEGARVLVIQIIPHHNGEIFLSKIALNQNPDFFGWPFTGRTIPKKPENPSYPQREPDPSALLSLYDNSGTRIHQVDIPNLNMVYYERKVDIRITITPSLARQIPLYSILVMSQGPEGSGFDYILDVYFPNSRTYQSYLQSCNITLPSGGKPVARVMGWI